MFDTNYVLSVLFKGKDELSGLFGKVAGEAKGLTTALGPAGMALALSGVVAGVAAATAAFARLGQEAGQIIALSRQLGTTTDEVQRLQFASGQLDVEMGSLVRPIIELQRRLPEVGDSLRRLGLTEDDIAEKAPTQVLLTLAQAFAQIHSQGERARLSMDLFARGGKEMLAIMGDQKELQDAIRATPLISPETLRAADAFDDGLKRILATTKAITANILSWTMNALDPIKMPRSMSGLSGYHTATGAFPVPNYDVERPPFPYEGPLNPDYLPYMAPGEPRNKGYRDTRRAREGTGADAWKDMAKEMKPIVNLQEEIRSGADDIVDSYSELGLHIQETRRSEEELGATMVDISMGVADSTAVALARATVLHENFGKAIKAIWKDMAISILAELNRIIARQIVAAVLATIIRGGSSVSSAISAATAAAGATIPVSQGGTELNAGTYLSVGRSRSVSVYQDLHLSTVFGGRSEQQAIGQMVMQAARAGAA